MHSLTSSSDIYFNVHRLCAWFLIIVRTISCDDTQYYTIPFLFTMYDKPVWNGHSQKDRKLVFKTNFYLMQAKSIAGRSKGASTILSTFIKLPSIFKIFVLSIFEWPFHSCFTVLYVFKSGGTTKWLQWNIRFSSKWKRAKKRFFVQIYHQRLFYHTFCVWVACTI